MKHILTLVLLGCLPLALQAANQTLEIAGRKVVLPAPEGFTLLTDDMPQAEFVTAQMADPMNDILAVYIPESEKEAVLAGEIPSLDRYFLVKINKRLRHRTLNKAQFDEAKAAYRSEMQAAFEAVKETMPDLMDRVTGNINEVLGTDMAFEGAGVIPLEPHHEHDYSISSSMHLSYDITLEGEQLQTQLTATCTCVYVNKVLLYLYSYGEQDELEYTRESMKQWLQSVMASNPDFRDAQSRAENAPLLKGILSIVVAAVIGFFLMKQKRS